MANHVSTKIRKRAIQLFGQGYSATQVGAQLGVSPHSVRVWARAAGVEKGRLLDKQLADLGREVDQEPVAAPPIGELSYEMKPLAKAVQEQQQEHAIKQAVDAGSSAIEQFQTLVATRGIKLLSEAFEAPPRPKNVRDIKVLADMVGDALGISKKVGQAGRLAIDLTVLTKPNNQVTIDVTDDGR